MAAPAQAPTIRKRGPSRALRLVRERLADPTWQPTIVSPKTPRAPELPYEEFCPGALADERCRHCAGSGIRTTLVRLKQDICSCVYRAIARRCAWEFKVIESIPQPVPRRRRGGTWFDWPRHEWAADFWMLVTRTLPDWRDRAVWVGMRIRDLQWQHIAPIAGLDRGMVFHRLYRADELIGEAVAWVRPYALWTPRMYCG